MAFQVRRRERSNFGRVEIPSERIYPGRWWHPALPDLSFVAAVAWIVLCFPCFEGYYAVKDGIGNAK
jgi:hypothetical protein